MAVPQLRPLKTVREYSFLSNPRTPSAVRQSLAVTALHAGGGEAEVARLARDYKEVKVLNVTNLGAIDVPRTMLSKAQHSSFTEQFRGVGGGWCCAPTDDSKKGQPKNAHFSLMKA